MADAAPGDGARPAAPPSRLDDTAVGERLRRVDELLERVENVPGPTSEAAMGAVQALTELYGEALARVTDLATPELRERLARDELLGHLLVLHDVHPEPVGRRLENALDRLRPALRERGAEVELVALADGTATVRLTSKGCGSSAGALEEAVREALLSVAPELTEVRLETGRRADGGAVDTAFVPLTSLTLRPAPAGDPA